MDTGRLHVAVEDQGQGFDWRQRLAYRPAPEATHGRGLTILMLYADAVRFNEAGNRVLLTKNLPGLRGPAVAIRPVRGGPSLAEDQHARHSH